MPWKIPWQKDNSDRSARKGNFYSLLRADIGEIRRQGDHPIKDGESFSRYICDLCHRSAPVSALRQCVICGRWACPDCWKDEYYVCSSCHGIIRLHLLELPADNAPPPLDTGKPEQPGKGGEKDPGENILRNEGSPNNR